MNTKVEYLNFIQRLLHYIAFTSLCLQLCECVGEVVELVGDIEVGGYYTIDKGTICATGVLSPSTYDAFSVTSQISKTHFKFPIGTTVLEKSYYLSLVQNRTNNEIYQLDAQFEVKNSCTLKVCDFSNLKSFDHCVEYEHFKDTSHPSTISVSPRTIFNCSCKTYTNEEFNIEFNRQYMGVVFQPYVKHYKRDGTIATWNSYSIDDVQTMLRIISSKITFISTYGMGATGGNRSWENGDAAGYVPVAAARLNLEFGSLRIRTQSAIWYNPDTDILNNEIENAFAASEAANKIFPNTVGGIIFTTEFVKDVPTANIVIKMLRESQTRARTLGFNIGIRLSNCNSILPPDLPESKNSLYNATNKPKKCLEDSINGSFEHVFQTILLLADFVICIENADHSYAKSDNNYIVKKIGDDFKRVKKCFKDVNPNVTFFGQTGWPSYGFSVNESPNNILNMRHYWNGWNNWCKQEKMQVFMFEAFDEPWKIDPNNIDANTKDGLYGSEGHYGWWERVEGEYSSSYIEKYQDISKSSPMEEKDAHNHKGSTSLLTWIIIVVSIGLVLVLCFIVSTYIMHHKLKVKQNQLEFARLSSKEMDMFMQGIPENEGNGDEECHVALRFPYNKSHEISKNHFTYDKSKMIGKGSGGTVYVGEVFQIEGPVAFKTTCSTSTIANLRSLLSEIKLLSYIGDHSHIVKFIGAHTDKIKYGEVYLAMEYCSVGCLEEYLQKRKIGCVSDSSCGITNYATTNIPVNYVSMEAAMFTPEIELQTVPIHFDELVKWCFQIADAMEYLGSKKIVHADLACRNVLLTENLTAKITDFGLSRKLDKYSTYLTFSEETPLPWRWMSPESLKRLKFSSESDLWSYGVTVWEIFSFGEIPYAGISWGLNFANDLESGLRLQKPNIATNEIYAQMRICWNADPTLRGTFTKLKEFFQNVTNGNSDFSDEMKMEDLVVDTCNQYTYLSPLKRMSF